MFRTKLMQLPAKNSRIRHMPYIQKEHAEKKLQKKNAHRAGGSRATSSFTVARHAVRGALPCASERYMHGFVPSLSSTLGGGPLPEHKKSMELFLLQKELHELSSAEDDDPKASEQERECAPCHNTVLKKTRKQACGFFQARIAQQS
jgi:hypothetical protein